MQQRTIHQERGSGKLLLKNVIRMHLKKSNIRTKLLSTIQMVLCSTLRKTEFTLNSTALVEVVFGHPQRFLRDIFKPSWTSTSLMQANLQLLKQELIRKPPRHQIKSSLK